MTERIRKGRPQDDVPVEQIIHYIVKDYQRMYDQFERLTDKLYEQQAEIVHLKRALERKSNVEVNREIKVSGEVKTQINNLTIKNESLTVQVATLKKEKNHITGKYNKLLARMHKFYFLLSQLPEELEEDDEP